MNSRLRQRSTSIAGAVVLAILACGLPGFGQADPPVVKTVPWVASSPLVPHVTYSGKAIRLKGTTDAQGAGIQYTWDFGDGSAVATGMVTNQYVIEAVHSYTGSAGAVYTARLAVQNTATGESANKAYYVEVRDRTLAVEADIAIDEGLWYLHKAQYRYASGGIDYGAWSRDVGYGSYAASGYHGVTAANVNAFEVNGHLESGDPMNPYTETVARGMRFVFTQLATRGLGTQPDVVNGGTYNPDVNGNGLGVYNAQNEAYQTGMLLDAIVASGTPNAVAATGPAGITGRRYVDIVQDMVDNISYCQYDSATLGGGWYYSCNGYVDNSISQWMAIGLLGAQDFGAALPQHAGTARPDVVRESNRNWLKSSQVAPAAGYVTGGYFGYQGTGTAWGPYATTASGMVQLALDGIGRGSSPALGPSWEGAETFMRENWDNDLIYPGVAVNSIKDYYYGLFSFTKSMLLHDPDGNGSPAPIRCLHSSRTGSTKPDIDWYAAEMGKVDTCSGLQPTSNGVARTLVNDQNAAGYWWAHNNDGNQYPFETAWAIMMLNRTVFSSGVPVAVAVAQPNPGVAGQTIVLDGSDSFHQDAAKSVVSWEWDLNNDGVYEITGPFVGSAFGALGDYPVQLRICDNGVPSSCATTIVIVRITIPPLPPSANAGGPYALCAAAKPWFLDGRGSINPDDGQSEAGRPGDAIMSHLWDLDGDGVFDDAAVAAPDVTAFFTARGPGSYVVQLKVTDSTATSFPSSGSGDLSDVDATIVSVKAATDPTCACVSNLAARPKSGKVQLSWTARAGADHYNIYRSTVSGGPYLRLASTGSTYATYLDAAVVNATTYYYVVREADLVDRELCQSNQASAKPATR